MAEPVWTLDEGLMLIRRMQPAIRKLNYHITLGGGVLNRGKSSKDLDLFIVPLNGHEPNAHPVTLCVRGYMDPDGPFQALRDSPDYTADAEFHYTDAYRFTHQGRRVDVFVG